MCSTACGKAQTDAKGRDVIVWQNWKEIIHYDPLPPNKAIRTLTTDKVTTSE